MKYIFEENDIKEGLRVKNNKDDKFSIYRVKGNISDWNYGLTNDTTSGYVVTVVGYASEMAEFLNKENYKPCYV